MKNASNMYETRKVSTSGSTNILFLYSLSQLSHFLYKFLK